MKLWVDDVRPCPDGWFWAKNATHAIEVLSNPPEGGITDASLDHDLGYIDPSNWAPGVVFAPGHTTGYDWEAPTGYDLVKWIQENDKWPSNSLAVHSANPVGAARMSNVIEDSSPYSKKDRYHVECNNLHVVTGWVYS